MDHEPAEMNHATHSASSFHCGLHMRVALFGANGFIGRALHERLCTRGDFEVLSPGSGSLDLTSPDAPRHLTHLLGSDCLLIVTARSRANSDPYKCFSNDIAMATNLAQAIAAGAVGRVIYFSSSAVYGDTHTGLAISEETPRRPSSLYGTGKVTAECLLEAAGQRSGVPVILLRPCMIYGPGDTSTAYGPNRFIRSALTDGQVQLFGDGSEVRDYLFIHDLVDLTLAVGLNAPPGVYNLATGQGHSFQELLTCLQRLLPRRFEVVSHPRQRPKADLQLDIRRLRAVVPAFPFTPLEQGLTETVHALLPTGYPP
jgi:UDP-glucose 4-epimerase